MTRKNEQPKIVRRHVRWFVGMQPTKCLMANVVSSLGAESGTESWRKSILMHCHLKEQHWCSQKYVLGRYTRNVQQQRKPREAAVSSKVLSIQYFYNCRAYQRQMTLHGVGVILSCISPFCGI